MAKAYGRAALPAAAAQLWTGTAACADAIDGEWCRASSNFRIDGPTIRTPAGNQLRGSYTRHRFACTVPANEPGAGAEFRVILVGEEDLDLKRTTGGATSPPERWIRGKPIS
jgi:hypothetical protein